MKTKLLQFEQLVPPPPLSSPSCSFLRSHDAFASGLPFPCLLVERESQDLTEQFK